MLQFECQAGSFITQSSNPLWIGKCSKGKLAEMNLLVAISGLSSSSAPIKHVEVMAINPLTFGMGCSLKDQEMCL